MADPIRSANISHNLARKYFWTCSPNNTVNGEHIEYLCPSQRGLGEDRPLRQPRAPGVILLTRLQGLSQSSPSRISQTDQAQAQNTVSDGVVLTATPVYGTGAAPIYLVDCVEDCSS